MRTSDSNQIPTTSANSQDAVLSCVVESSAVKMLMKLPVCIDWVKYKGEDVVIQWNLEATEKARKPMLDVSYCMTKALNQVIDETVQWDKSKFNPSHLGKAKW